MWLSNSAAMERPMLSASIGYGNENNHSSTEGESMSKLISFVLLAAAISVGTAQAANAGHRYYRCYSWYYYPPAPVAAEPAASVPPNPYGGSNAVSIGAGGSFSGGGTQGGTAGRPY
jgi:hypothetical protein